MGEIAVVTLMEGEEAEEVGCRAVCGNGAPAVPMDDGGIVREGRGRGVATISQKGEDVLMGKGAGQFEVGVGNGAVRLAVGDEEAADVGGKGGAPEGWGVGCVGGYGAAGLSIRGNPNPAHTGTGGITGAEWCKRGDKGYQFGEAGGPGGDVGGNGPEIIEGGLDVVVEADATFGDVAEGELEVREQAPAAREGNCHAAEFTEESVPRLDGDAVVAADLGEDCQEAVVAMWGEFEGHAHGVEVPAQ